MRKKSNPRFALALVLALAVLGSVVAMAGEAETPASEPNDTKARAAVAAEPAVSPGGLTVFIDPETGAFRAPTAEEAAALSAAMANLFAGAAASAPTMKQHRDGMLSAQLPFEYMEFTVAHRGEDGKLHYNCVDDHQQATQYIQTQTAQTEEQ